jgi:mRNA interferase RelE/StbE
MVEITFTDGALDDLRRIGPSAVPKVLKKVLLLLDSPRAGYPLGGDLTGFRKLIVGCNNWRIVYRLVDDKTIEICEVWAVGARADAEVYAEATARIQGAAGQHTEFRALADVIERLGRIAGDVVAPRPPLREPVPNWLAKRLVHSVGMSQQDVAALSLEEAVDRWGAFMSKPPGDVAFTTTRPVVKLIEVGTSFVARSEARRLLNGLDVDFETVEVDFTGVPDVGQGFVDELLRVWPRDHPGKTVIPTNMNAAVDFMVRRGLGTASPGD